MNEPTVGFAVLYRWRLHPGREGQFEQAWERTTPLLMRHRGALGSRLPMAEYGTWVAYVLWRSRQAWELARTLPSVDAEASRQMLAAEAEAFAPVLLTLIVARRLRRADDHIGAPSKALLPQPVACG
jgi:heme-degrading monooxygenase HmoA